MSERFKELVSKTDDFMDQVYPEWYSARAFYQSIWSDKFAELIVRECAEMMPQDNLYKMVLKHFGVEE